MVKFFAHAFFVILLAISCTSRKSAEPEYPERYMIFKEGRDYELEALVRRNWFNGIPTYGPNGPYHHQQKIYIGRCGFINEKGEIVIKPIYWNCKNFSEGLTAVSMDGIKWGFLNPLGEWVIKPRFEEAYDFSNGFAHVQKNNRLIYINERGEELPGKFESAGSFGKDGLASVKIKRKHGYIDNKGKIIIDLKFDGAHLFSEGLAGVKIKGKWGFINTTGNLIISPIYKEVGIFSNDLAPVKYDSLWGFIDRTGKYVIDPQYDWAGDFSEEGIGIIEKSKIFFFINKKGEKIINEGFKELSNFIDGIAGVDEKTFLGYIDKKGNFILRKKKSEGFVGRCKYWKTLLCLVKKNNTYYYNREGKEVFPK